MRSVFISKGSVLASLFSLLIVGATGCGGSDGAEPAQGGGPAPVPGSLNLYLVDAIVEDWLFVARQRDVNEFFPDLIDEDHPGMGVAAGAM